MSKLQELVFENIWGHSLLLGMDKGRTHAVLPGRKPTHMSEMYSKGALGLSDTKLARNKRTDCLEFPGSKTSPYCFRSEKYLAL
jgi:hypothetical protein